MVPSREASGQRHYGQKWEIVCQEEKPVSIPKCSYCVWEKRNMTRISPVSCAPGQYLEQLEGSKTAVYPISEFIKFRNGARAAAQETSLLGTVHYVTCHLADFHKMKSLLFCKFTLTTYAT